jgi:hypothetical protein
MIVLRQLSSNRFHDRGSRPPHPAPGKVRSGLADPPQPSPPVGGRGKGEGGSRGARRTFGQWLRAGLTMVAFAAISGAALAQGNPAKKPPAAAISPTSVVAPAVDRLLQEVGAYIGSAKAFTFHADVTFDHVLPSGQKLQFAAAEEAVLERPGRLYVEWNGDLGARQFWYDGKTAALYDPATPFYASAAAPPTIDAMLKELVPKLDFVPPLSDFLYRSPYETVRGNIEYGFDLGQNDVNGKTCRTLAFVGKDIDWQIWIENGPRPTPCKLVITYKKQPEQPQFTAVFSNWDFAPRIDPAVFTPELPPGTEKIPFATVAAAK